MWTHFLKLHGRPKFNSSHWATYCKGCIQHEKELLQNTRTFDSVDYQHGGQSFVDGLFGGAKKPVRKFAEREINAEAELMEALADAEEDARLEDGAVECDDDEVYAP
ncbi:hypothetical protein R3P38DRAFT_3287881 [Favolaschia claudopus]|uniref:Uncharacterized protein n=1 Tax=Favolaschia claudopus TaxID=2862362 RepID=A0AAV9ZY71_9AGAR